jgi:hypothetical protein
VGGEDIGRTRNCMFESLTAVGVLIAFLIPGYVWWSTEALLVYVNRKQEWERFALTLLLRSTINYLPWGPVLWRIVDGKLYETAPFSFSVVCTVLVFVQPAVLGLGWGFFHRSGRLQRALEKIGLVPYRERGAPTAWEALFAEMPPRWLIVTLKDGAQVRGWYGKGSFASSDGEQRDLFLSHLVVVQPDGTSKLVENTAGVYIGANEIKTVEFIQNPI